MRFRPGLSALMLSVTLVAGCSSGTGAWEDQRYATLMETAGSIFKLGHVRQAAQQYAAALDRAFLSNDPQAIHDAGFNLATSQLRMKAYGDCLATVEKVSQALSKRGWGDVQQADLHLIRATVLYRQSQWQASEAEAVTAGKSGDDETIHESYALTGLDAAALSDRPGLEAAIARLSTSTDLRDQANLKELVIHRDIMDHHWQQAAGEARILVSIRREAFDYEAMRRALTLEAKALQAMGQSQAAADALKQASDSAKARETP